MIKIIEGNILEAIEDIVAHQTNCMGVMGSGLAKQIKDKYYKVFEEYQKYCHNNKFTALGNCQIINVSKDKYVANLFGQYKYDREKQHTDYEALEEALFSLKVTCKDHNKTVTLPYNLSCKLTDGDWNIVYDIIENVFKDYNITIYKYNP